MRRSTVGVIAVLGLVWQVTDAATQILSSVPDSVTLGTFNTFETRMSSIVIKNVGREAFEAASVKADCTCVRARLKDNEIAPNSQTSLQVFTMLRTEGEFSHDIMIIPKNKERHLPLRIQAKGRALEPVVSAIGWEGGVPSHHDPGRTMDMGVVHRLSAKPVIYVMPKNDRFDVRDAVIDVNSSNFELYDYRLMSPAGRANISSGREKNTPVLGLTLSPKRELGAGTLRDYVIVKLAPRVSVHVSLTCRVVGNVYADPERICLGDLSSSEPASLSVHFVGDYPRWKQVRWRASGPLSSALAIDELLSQPDTTTTSFRIAADPSKLCKLGKGYSFARLTLHENEPTENETVTVIVDGFN
jgi:hypothetical protein